ncbi:Sensor histidine kinase ResE [bioreactor metagenome]|uniref:histidine kinase n=1 Tax=bioreactor metagenome TaxID=1076179 RepID=A0A645FLN5_9ZZZZ
MLSVRDTGIGIPEEDITHLFDRFYRVDKARSRGTGGTGLGLSIVDKIVQLHNGYIEVHSEEGVGSEFIVRLPMVQNHD